MPKIAGYITTETLFESSATAVFHAHHAITGQTVVLKLLRGEHPTSEDLDRFTREYKLISSFDSSYVLKAYGLEKYQNSQFMLLEDYYGSYKSLAAIIKNQTFTLHQLLHIFIEITKALETVHSKKIIYRDLSPETILLRKDYRHIKFHNFNIATPYESKEKGSRPSRLPEGSLPYISPEQTGRIEHSVDYRSDFYSLGITFFQLATGCLPFSSRNVNEIIHAHLAHTPPPPNQLNPSIPAPLSAIILKLLTKSKSGRYQTCHGLLDDLNHCLLDLDGYSKVGTFEPGQHDTPVSLHFRSTPYQRDKQLQQLHAGFNRARKGGSEIILIQGRPGTGKSSILQSFQKNLLHKHPYILYGTFDSVIATTPYKTIVWSVSQIVSQILSESFHAINFWKDNLQQLDKEDCALLTNIIPQLAQLLGTQDPPTNLEHAEAEHRFHTAFTSFLQLCCRTASPLVFILDDLDKAPPTSLKLLEYLLTSADTSHLLVIGTHSQMDRSSSTGVCHALTKIISMPNVQHLTFENLDQDTIEVMLSDLLARDKEDMADIARLCLQKTDGHPSHLKQFLQTLQQEGILFYSKEKRQWECNTPALRTSPLTPNTAQVLAQKVESLPPATLNLLKIAACLRECFARNLLIRLGNAPPEENTRSLQDALRQGFICDANKDNQNSDEATCYYHFIHGKIRQAILASLNTHEQSTIRLHAGQHLLKTLQADDYHHSVFEIADYLNSGTYQVTLNAERLEIAQVNLDAGRKAKLSEKFSAAHTYFTAGTHALPQDSWTSRYSLTLELHNSACETAYLSGNYHEVEHYFQTICAKSTDVYETCRVYRIYIRTLKAQSQPEKAVSASLEILGRLGVHIPAHPSKIHSLTALMHTRFRLMRFSQSRLLMLPEMTNKHAHVIMGFLHDTGTAAYSANPWLLPLLCTHAIRLSLKHGNSQESSVLGYLTYGFLLCGLSARYIKEGYEFGQLALQLQKQLSNNTNSCQSTYVYNSFICHWNDHIRTTLPAISTAIKDCLSCGDLDMAANASFSLTFRHFLTGKNLTQTGSVINEQFALISKLNQQLQLTRLKIFWQAIANLQSESVDHLVLKGQYYDENKSLPAYLAAKDYSSYCVAILVKMILAVLFHDYQRALDLSQIARKHISHITASAFIPVYFFYDSLALLANYNTQSLTARMQSRLRIASNQRKMKLWSYHAPQNYSHKFSLIEAERERINGNTERAIEWYDTAIYQAKENEYLQEEALAYELAARFYSNRRKPHIASSYLREARYCYYMWGATAKVAQIDQQEWIGQANLKRKPQRHDQSDQQIVNERASRLDMLTIIKASRVLSSEMVFDELLKKVMQIMLESGGAQRGFLIFKENSEWIIKVRGSTTRNSIVTLTHLPVPTQRIASTSIINYVIHTGNDVVLEDACEDGTFTRDTYVQQEKIRSVICMPIIHQNEIFAILYLENNLSTGAFPPDRQELLHLLGTQASISLSNSKLFEKLEGTVNQLASEVEKRRSTQQQLLHAEKLSALGRLSASIAHEFGNPLMGVKYLLDDFYKREELNENDRQLVELGLEECERMKNLIKNLQRLNKPSSGKKSRTNIHSVLDNILLFQKKHFSANRIQLRKEFDLSLPEVDIIVDQITQVLFNLTINAVDSMNPNGGVLKICTRRHEQGIAIDIQDTGTGIPYENQEQVFEPFFSSKKEEDGTGLGLSISYGIVRYHKGDLSFVSKPGEGATFTLTLPDCVIAQVSSRGLN